MQNTVLARRADFHPAQFGWSKANPPKPADYHVPVSASDLAGVKPGQDISTLKNPKPSDAFVKKVAPLLVGMDKPRFALLTGLKEKLKLSVDQIHAFQKNLMEALGKHLQATRPDVILPAEGMNVQMDHSNGFNSARSVHWDGSRLFSIGYGPNHNVKDGKPLLFDFPQLVKDKQQWIRQEMALLGKKYNGDELSFPQAMDFLGLGGGKFEDMLRQDYAHELKENNPDTDLPILVLNDNVNIGLAHGATDPVVSGKSPSRPISRVTVNQDFGFTDDDDW